MAAPVVSTDTITILEDAEVDGLDQVIRLTQEQILGSDFDPDGDALQVTRFYFVRPDGSEFEFELDADGGVEFALPVDFTGEFTFGYDVTDGDTTVSSQLNLVIENTYDAPVLASRADVTVLFDDDGDDFTFTLTEADLLARFASPDGTALSVVGVEAARFQDGIEIVNNEDGTWTLTIVGDERETREDLLSGFVDSSLDVPVELAVTVSDGVTEFTDDVGFVGRTSFSAPSASGDFTIAVDEGGSATFALADVLALFSDADGDAIAFDSIQTFGQGTITDNGDGTVTFQLDPNTSTSGDIFFTLSVNDGALQEDGGNTGTARIIVDLDAFNSAPSILPAFFSAEDQRVELSLGELESLASDPEGDAFDVSAVGVGRSGRLSVVDANGNVLATATAGELVDLTAIEGAAGIVFQGSGTRFSDEIVVEVTDGNGRTVSQTLIVSDRDVEPANVDREIPEDGSATFNVFDTTLSGFSEDDFPAGQVPEFVNAYYTVGGTAEIVNGEIVFTADPDFSGRAYVLAYYDLNNNFSPPQFTQIEIDVTPVNDAPELDTFLLGTVAVNAPGPFLFTSRDIIDNASDAEGDVINVNGVSVDPSQGTIELGPEFEQDGELVQIYLFFPNPGFSGPAAITVTVGDGTSTTTTDLTIQVGPTNSAPIASDTRVEVLEDTVLRLDSTVLTENDLDPDGDDLFVISVQDAVGGRVELVDGIVVFTPDADFAGEASFTYTVSDIFDAVATATAFVDIQPVNDAPVAAGDLNFSTLEDTAVVIDPAELLLNDTDADGDALEVVSVQDAEGGTVSFDGTSITFVPRTDFNGDAFFTYTVRDPSGATSTAFVLVEVESVNDAPVAVDDTGFASTNGEAVEITFSSVVSNDRDVDGRFLELALEEGSAFGGTVEVVGSQFVFTPDPGFVGTATFSYRLSDGALSDTATVEIEVSRDNSTPVGVNDRVEAVEDTPLVIDMDELLGNDTDADGDALFLVGVVSVLGGTVEIVGDTVVFTPFENFSGEASFTYTVTDGVDDSTATVFIDVAPVNDGPVARDVAVEATEDTVLTLDPSVLLAAATDVDGDALAVASVQDAVGGTVELVDGVVVFTPTENFNGEASFTFTVSDGNGGTTTATATVDVAAVNDGPTARDVAVEATEDTVLRLAASVLLDGAADVDGDALTIASVQDAVGGMVELVDGVVVFTPTENFNGEASFTFTVSDGNGGTTTATATVDVAAVNDGPTARDVELNAFEDTVFTVDAGILAANAADLDGDALAVTSVQDAVGGTVELVDGVVVFTPTENFNGEASFTYTVSDGNGGEATATANVDVASINDGPVARDVAVEAIEDTVLSLDTAVLLAAATDADGDALAVTSVQDAVGGAVELVDGVVVFTPTENFNGEASFTYTVRDGNGGTTTATATVDVAAVNDAPEAEDGDLGERDTRDAVTISLADVAGLVSDVDGDTLSLVSVVVVSGAASVLEISPGVFEVTPEDGATDLVLSYTVSDGGLTATGTLDVGFPEEFVNTAPVAVDDEGFEVDEGDSLSIATAALLANDTDADGDALTITSVQDAVGGTVSLVNGAVVFEAGPATAGVEGEASFTYTVSDGAGGSSTATVVVDVLEDEGPSTVPTQGDDVLSGTAGRDVIRALAGDDVVDGGAGRDRLFGQNGDDVLVGGTGSDLLVGGRGNDTLTGDAVDGTRGRFDRDVFFLGRVDEGGGSGNDVITDFDTNGFYGGIVFLDFGGEENYDTVVFDFQGRRFFLDSALDLLRFTSFIEGDGDLDTSAIADGDDLVFVFRRDDDGFITDSIRLEDVIGQNGLSRFLLDIFSVDTFEGDPGFRDDAAGAANAADAADAMDVVDVVLSADLLSEDVLAIGVEDILI